MSLGNLDISAVTVVNGLAMGALLLLIAGGLSLIYGQARVLNLAHGTFFMVGAYLAHTMMGAGAGLMGLAATLLVAAIVGALMGGLLSLAMRPLSGRGPLDQALVTLGVALVAAEIVSTIWGNDVHSIGAPAPFDGSVQVFGSSFPVYRVVVIGLGVAVAAAIYWGFDRTNYGAVIRAGVEDRGMLAATGRNPSIVVTSVFALGGALAAVSGVIGAPILGARPGIDNEVLILGLIVVVVGGLGSIKGAFVGAVLIGQVQVLGVAIMPAAASFLLFATMGLMLLVRPTGMFGAVSRRHA